MPHFINVHPELGKCLQRTINVVLECQLEIVSPTFTIGPIRWHPDALEMFGFQPIVFQLDEPKLETDAWIYIPYGSPHRLNPFYAEVLAPLVELGDRTACKIQLIARKVIA
jgi:hypothetical protein